MSHLIKSSRGAAPLYTLSACCVVSSLLGISVTATANADTQTAPSAASQATSGANSESTSAGAAPDTVAAPTAGELPTLPNTGDGVEGTAASGAPQMNAPGLDSNPGSETGPDLGAPGLENRGSDSAHESGVEQKPTTTLMVETDPATFFFGGYAVHVRMSPAAAPAFAFGLGMYGMELPKPLAEMDPEAEGKGWEVVIRNAYSGFADYHFSGKPEGFFAGVQAGVQRMELTREETGEERAEYWNFIAMPRAGYLWHPISDAGLYLMPWLGVGAITPISGERTVGDEEYPVFPVIAFATLHVGWSH